MASPAITSQYAITNIRTHPHRLRVFGVKKKTR